MAANNQPIIGDFNLGQAITIIITDSNGNSFDLGSLGLLMKFSGKADDKLIEVDSISNQGRPAKKGIPRGYKGSITWARRNGSLAKLMLAAARDFFSGAGVLTLYTMGVVIANDDGSADKNTFTGTTLYNFDFGSWESNKEVNQSIEWAAQECLDAS